MIHGPGCPVCVTPLEQIDKALAIAARPNVIFTSYGDMLRVPGTDTDLLALKARGADVRIVYSPLDALKIAKDNPDKEVVFFAVGFETTAPANAMAIAQAKAQGIDNYSVVVSHVLVPPAMTSLLDSPTNQVQSFLAAGHVCAVMGWTEYEPIAEKYKVPIVVTGFEPLDLLEGMLMAIRQLEEGRHEVENQYARAVKREGVPLAQKQIFDVFEVGDRTWRGVGEIPQSGYHLRPGVRGLRRGDQVRRRRHPHPRAPGLHRGPDPDRREAADRLHRLRHAVLAPAPARRPDGQRGGHLRGLPRGQPGPGRTESERRMTTIDPLALTCPVPIPEGSRVILGHGSGGQLSGALMRDVLAPCLADASPGGPLNDAAVLELGGTRVAFTTDSFVVSPAGVPRRGHRRARRQRHGQRPGDDGRPARRACRWRTSSRRGCRWRTSAR